MRPCLILFNLICGHGVVASTKGALTTTTPPMLSRPDFVRKALSEGRNLYYFGLGSNMLRSKIENRGINGTRIELISMEPAIVPGYRLAFNMRGFPPLEPGMGAIEPCNDNNINESRPLKSYHRPECHGALVLLTAENYEKVMQSEGVGLNNTNPGYEEIVVDAYPYNNGSSLGQPVQAVALRARPHVRLNKDPAPSQRYMNILRQGAAELGLKPCYQQFLADHPTQQSPMWIRRLAINNMIFTFTLSRRMMKPTLWSRAQSKLLFWVYVVDSKGPRKLLSDATTAMILFPGAILGSIVRVYHKVYKKEMPMFLSRMLKLMEDDSAKRTPTKTALS